MAAERFFASLPRERLLPEEDALVKLLEALATKIQSFLPRVVSLQEWADKRVPDDMIDVISITQMSVNQLEEPPPEPLAQDSVSCSAIRKENDKFFSQLPENEFLSEELELREKLLAIMKRACRPRGGHRRGSHSLVHIEKAPQINSSVDSLLPHGVSLLEWIQRRLDDDIEAIRDDEMIILLRRAKDPNVHRQDVEEFLSGLPAESFTAAEEDLRDALLRFIESWQSSTPPRLTDVAQAPGVSEAKKQLLPEGVSLKAWITSRLGGEVDLIQDATGQYAIGFVGQLDASQIEDYSLQTKGTKRAYAYGGGSWAPKKR